MLPINRTRLVTLRVAELNRIVSWFAEAYDRGWRPKDWSPESDGALRAKLERMEQEQIADNGDVPWV